MIIFLAIWSLMAALAVACAGLWAFSFAVAAWCTAAAIVCATGAFLISRQPVGVITAGGRCGAAVIQWGFRAGHGRLALAAMISFAVWLVVGTTTIAAIHFPAQAPILAASAGDLLGLFYIAGVMFANPGGRIQASLMKVVASIVGLIAASLFLWFHVDTDRSRAVAVALAGGPPLLAGASYGFVLAMGCFSGRSRRY